MAGGEDSGVLLDGVLAGREDGGVLLDGVGAVGEPERVLTRRPVYRFQQIHVVSVKEYF